MKGKFPGNVANGKFVNFVFTSVIPAEEALAGGLVEREGAADELLVVVAAPLTIHLVIHGRDDQVQVARVRVGHSLEVAACLSGY